MVNRRPRLQILKEEDICKIHGISMKILGEIGVKILYDDVLHLLTGVGGAIRELLLD